MRPETPLCAIAGFCAQGVMQRSPQRVPSHLRQPERVLKRPGLDRRVDGHLAEPQPPQQRAALGRRHRERPGVRDLLGGRGAAVGLGDAQGVLP